MATEPKQPKDNQENNQDRTTPNQNTTGKHPDADTNKAVDVIGMTVDERHTHKRRRRPRRSGAGSQASVSTDPASSISSSTDLSSTSQEAPPLDSTPADLMSTDLISTADAQAADDAAMSEGGIKGIGGKRIINFMKIEKPMAIFSILMIIVSLGALVFNGLNLGLDFTGGVSADVSYESPVEQTEVIDTLAQAGFDDAVVQYLGSNQELLVRLPPQSDTTDGLEAQLNTALDMAGNDATISSVSIIGSQVGNEVYLNSLLAIAVALGLMMAYVAMRFQFKLAVGALLALFHDAVVVLGVFAIFQFPFDLTVLAAILALIGYSLNDTIVVYDRIRENFRRVRGALPRQIIDLSLTETLRRTIMTISTVLLVVLAMLFLGGAGLFWFSVALFIGLIAGTYSSIYISSSIPLAMGISRDDFIVTVKPEFVEEVVSFNDPKAFSSDDFEDETRPMQ